MSATATNDTLSIESCKRTTLETARFTFHRTWFEEANEQLSSYLQTCPESALAHAYLAIVDMLLYRDPSMHANKARRLNESSADEEAFLVEALVDFSQGRLEEAEARLRQHLTIVPDDRFASHVLGFTLIDQGNPSAGLQVLTELMRTHPDYYPGLTHLAYALQRTGNGNEALRVADELVAADPLNPSTWDTRADILNESGKVDEAISSLTRSMLLDARFAYGWKHLGDIFASAGESALAEIAYRKAIAASDLYGAEFVRSVEAKLGNK